MGKNLVFLPECHSTNTVALERSHESSTPEGTLVITDHQTLGRGQRGSQWNSEKGSNLTFSVVLQPRFLAPKDQFMLSKAVSLAIHDVLETLLPYEVVRIKWPNDILISGKKVCGILVENQLAGSTYESAIVGIGLNVNQQEFPVPTAASLFNFSFSRFDLNVLLDELCASLENRYLQLKRGDWDQINAAYLSVLYWREERHEFFAKGANFEGVIEGVDEVGRLLVRSGAHLQSYDLKEILYKR